MRFKTDGRLDFCTLENIAGRGRRYHRIVIDEAAFAENGDNKTDGSMMELWEKAIKPTLFDYDGQVLVCSNSAGKNSDNARTVRPGPQSGLGRMLAHFSTPTEPTKVGILLDVETTVLIGVGSRRRSAS